MIRIAGSIAPVQADSARVARIDHDPREQWEWALILVTYSTDKTCSSEYYCGEGVYERLMVHHPKRNQRIY